MLIIFDLDDTLIDTSGSIVPYKLHKALQAMINRGLVVDHFHKALEILKMIDAYSESTLHALKEFLEIHDVPQEKFLEVACHEVYHSQDFEQDVLPTKGAIETLFDLSKKHSLAIVSAGVLDIQLEKMKKAGIDTSIFSRIVVCKEGGKKQYYEQILGDLKFQPRDVVVCGDRIIRDLSPAKALGCFTIHMKWGRGLRQKREAQEIDFSIASLDQLKSIILQLEKS